MVNPNEHDHFVMRQRIRLVVNEYEFALPGEEERPFCFVRQKRFKFKEDIRFYADASRRTELMRIKARRRFDPAARYDVTTPAGAKFGEIQKVFGASLLRSTYALFDAGGNEVARAQERDLAVAILRRVIGFVPYLEMVANWLPIPYDFEFRSGDRVVGHHRRRLWQLRDVYDLDLSGDPDRLVDRHLALAAAIGMDALQAR